MRRQKETIVHLTKTQGPSLSDRPYRCDVPRPHPYTDTVCVHLEPSGRPEAESLSPVERFLGDRETKVYPKRSER